jgi:hypothetical protein
MEYKPNYSLMKFVARVRRYNDYPPGFGSLMVMLVQKIINSCPLSIKKTE